MGKPGTARSEVTYGGRRKSFWFAAWGLVCGFFLNGTVFLSGRGGGFFPVQDMPAIVDAGDVTAGRAQLGMVLWLRSVGDDCWVWC